MHAGSNNFVNPQIIQKKKKCAIKYKEKKRKKGCTLVEINYLITLVLVPYNDVI